MRLLILGSKEFPLGSNKGDDPISSGGIESYTQELVREFQHSKIFPIVITRTFKGFKNYERSSNLEIHRVPWLRGFWFRNISFNLFSTLKAFSLQFDAILSQSLFSTLAGWVLSRAKGVPLISRPAGVVWTQSQYPFFIRWILLHLERFAYGKADLVVFVSEEERTQFRKKLGFVPISIVIETGVRIRNVSRRERAKVRREFSAPRFLIAWVGRLIQVKGLAFLIEAVSIMKKKSLQFKLVLVGDGPDRISLEALVKEKGLSGQVIFAGQRHDVPQILAASDIFVLPSLSEGLPIALLEALAAARPTVVTSIGLPVKPGKTALVVPPKDAVALAKSLERLMQDGTLRANLGKNGRALVKTKFNWKKAVKGYEALLQRLK